MDIILDTNKPLVVAIKEVLDKICLLLFESKFENIGRTIKNKKYTSIHIYLTNHFSFDIINNYPELSYWFKNIRSIASLAIEEGITILPIIYKEN